MVPPQPDDRDRRELRAAVIRGSAPDPQVLVVPMLVTIVLLPLAYAFFKRTEANMADVI